VNEHHDKPPSGTPFSPCFRAEGRRKVILWPVGGQNGPPRSTSWQHARWHRKNWTRSPQNISKYKNTCFLAFSEAREQHEQRLSFTLEQLQHAESLLRSPMDSHAKWLLMVHRNSGERDPISSQPLGRVGGGAGGRRIGTDIGALCFSE
jgi:hypothetical protein